MNAIIVLMINFIKGFDCWWIILSPLSFCIQVNNENIFFNLDYTYNKKDDPNRFYERSAHTDGCKKKLLGAPGDVIFGPLNISFSDF